MSAIKKKVYTLTKATGDTITYLNHIIKKRKIPVEINTSEKVQVTPNKQGTTRLFSINSGNTYINLVKFFDGKQFNELFIQETPPGKNYNLRSHASRNEITFRNYPSIEEYAKRPEQFNNVKTKSFAFTVSSSTIQHKQPRKGSQKQANDGISAADVFKAASACIFNDKKNRFHLSHNQGHCFSGKMEKENLEAATAGCNITILNQIERVIIQLIKEDPSSDIAVKGTVFYHPEAENIPIRIHYDIEMNNGTSYSTDVYPLEQKMPPKGVTTMIKTLLEHKSDMKAVKINLFP